MSVEKNSQCLTVVFSNPFNVLREVRGLKLWEVNVKHYLLTVHFHCHYQLV